MPSSVVNVFWMLVLASCFTFAGCDGCSNTADEDPWKTSEQEPDAGEDPTIVGMVLEPTEATVLLQTSRQFAALATFSDGATRDVTMDAAWDVLTDGVATVHDGEVAATAPGSTTVEAAFGGYAAQARITVPSALPESLRVRPEAVDVAVGEVIRLRADVVLTDGVEFDATELVAWSSSNLEVAVVSNDPPDQGAVRGVSDGTAVVTARLGEVEARADVSVGVSAQLATIEIAPGFMRLVAGQRQPFEVLARYSDGRIVDVSRLARVTSTDESVVTVDDLAAFAVAPGAARIDAELEGRLASAMVDVTDATVTAIDVTPDLAETSIGGGVDFTATARLDDDTSIPFDDAVSWRVVNPATASIDDGGVAVGTAAGTTNIEARFGAIFGASTLTVFDAPLVAIDVEPFDPTVVIGTRWTFTAIGRFANNRLANLSWSCSWDSSSPDTVSITELGRADAVGLGVSVVSCAWDGVVGASATTVTSSDLAALEIEPLASTITPGQTIALRVLGRHNDGRTTDLTESATWTADAAAVSVSNATGSRGRVTGLALGIAEISAEFAGVATTATVRVSDSPLLTMRIEPANVASLPLGAELPLRAVGRYDDGTERDLTEVAQWSSDDPGIVAVHNGVVRGVAFGAATVTAVLDSVRATATVTVTDAVVDRIEVQPTNLVTTRGQRTDMSARAFFSDGTEMDVTAAAIWSVDDPSIAFVGNGTTQAQLVALDAGETNVNAEYRGILGTTKVTVEGAPLDSITISPAVVRVAVGVDTQLVVIARYVDGTTENVTTRANWSSDLPGVASVNGTGLVVPRLPGATQIRAQYQGATAAASFTVTDASVVMVEIAPFEATIAAGDEMWFQAIAHYSDGTKLNVTRRAIWDSLDESIVRVESIAYLSGVTLAVAPGTTTIVAYFDGIEGRAEVTVTDATVVSIQVFPTNYSMPIGTELLMTAQAIYSDGSSRNINWLGRWTSSDPTVAVVGNAWPVPGLVTANAPGSTTIEIEYQGQTATAEIDVSDAALVAIQVFPFNSSITVGSPIWFQATGIFSDGRSVWLTRDVTWTSTDASVASISNGLWSEGRTIGVAPGQTAIQATWNGVTGSATLVVSNKAVTAIQVTPFLARIPAGYGELFQAVAIFDDNTSRNITQLATWETSNPAIGSVGNVWWTSGIVLTHSGGQIDVLASWQNVIGRTSLTVTDAEVISIDVTPPTASVLPGEVLEYEALGHFDDGSTYDLTLWSTWLTADTAVANVSNAWGAHGEATAFSAGTTEVQAHKDGVLGTAMLEVR